MLEQILILETFLWQVTPKGESPVTPEEIIKSNVGEKATDVKDTSLDFRQDQVESL